MKPRIATDKKSFLPGLLICLTLCACNSVKKVPQEHYLLQKNTIRFSEKIQLEKGEVEPFVRQKPNRKILGFIRFHLGIYNLVNEEKVLARKIIRDKKRAQKNDKRVARGKKPKKKERLSFREWLLEIGEAPVLYDSILKEKSSRQVKLFMNSKGYFNATITDSVSLKHKKARIFYTIRPSLPYKVRNIRYAIDDNLVSYFVLSDTSACLIRSGENYDVDVLQKERERITRQLKNNGYFGFSKEFIYYQVDSSLKSHSLDLVLGIKKFTVRNDMGQGQDSLSERSHTRHYINEIYIQTDFNPRLSDRIPPDTLRLEDFIFLYSDALQYKTRVLIDAVYFRKGELYQSQKVDDTYRRLSELKAFRMVNIVFKEDEKLGNHLNCFIQLNPVLKQSFTVETEGTNSSGNLGVAGSFVYQNRNFFRGAEVLEVKIKGGMEVQKIIGEKSSSEFISNELLTFNTIEFGPEVSLSVPRFLLPPLPFKINVSKNANPKTNFTGALHYQKRPDYTRNILNASYGFTWKETLNRRHIISPLEINLVKVSLQPDFEASLKSKNDLLLINSFSDHLTGGFRYSFIFNEQTFSKLTSFLYLRVNAESAGNLLRGIYNLTNQEMDKELSYRLFDIKFSQYLRIDGDFRYYKIYNRFSRVVFRAYAGVGKPLHNLRVLPFEKSFFGGGSNDIRAWKARSLGPGSFASALGENFDQLGDAQLEGNAEYRFNLFRSLNAAIFVDAGNIWLRKADLNRPGGEFSFSKFYKEFAVGSGIGFRIDFNFFIIRLDMGVKMRDPMFGTEGRWVVRHLFDAKWKKDHENYFGGKYSFLNFNLGIGYPF